MLRGHGLEGSLLDRPLAFAAAEEEQPPPPPERIGPYRLERLLGRGGMGEVHLARREGEDFQQRVAIKMLRGWFHGETLTRRFRTERRILARLEHPNIARLLDGGTTEDGRLYLIMEYVDGVPIDRYCDQHGLSVSDRLNLFEQVCSAVALAHRNLIVHRDLKPGNILVTRDGVPKLLDFGIAKLLGESADDGPGSSSTATWQRPMTPEYASPEQVEGRPITTSTDIYALGVLLYRLLTGVSPYPEASSDEPAAVLEAVRRGEVTRPSSRVFTADGAVAQIQRARARRLEPASLVRRLRGDLDILVATALHKDPERRYPSVESLAEDVRRHLSGQPIRARPDTLAYRLGKFLRRQPLIAAAALLVILFAISVTVLAIQLARQRDQLQLEQAKSQKVVDFSVGLFEVTDPNDARGRTVTARDLLERGADQVHSELEGQGELQAIMLDLLGQMHFNLGLYDEAKKLLTEALVLSESHYEPVSERVAFTLDNLAAVYRQQGDLEEAEALYRRALGIRRQLFGPTDFVLAESLNNLGVLRWRQQDREGARVLISEALDITRAALGPDDPQVASALNNLAALYQASGSPDDLRRATPLLEQAIAINRRTAGADAPSLGIQLHNLGRLHQAEGDLPKAESALRQALDILEPALGDQHEQTRSVHSSLASVLRAEGRLPAARRELEQAVGAVAAEPGDAVHPREVAMRNSLVQVLVELGDLELAASVLEEAESLHPRFGEEGIAVALENNRARLLLARGQAAAAASKLEGLLERAEGDHRRISLGLDLVQARLVLGDWDGASAALDEVERLQAQALPDAHPDRVRTLLRRSELQSSTGQAASATSTLEAARALAVAALGPSNCLQAAVDARLARTAGAEAKSSCGPLLVTSPRTGSRPSHEKS